MDHIVKIATVNYDDNGMSSIECGRGSENFKILELNSTQEEEELNSTQEEEKVNQQIKRRNDMVKEFIEANGITEIEDKYLGEFGCPAEHYIEILDSFL